MPLRGFLIDVLAVSAGIAVALAIRRVYNRGSRRVRMITTAGVFLVLAAALVTALTAR